MRMLLHDNQATLEKFSGHVEKLTSRVDDAKREIATAHRIFQFGHEKLVEENVSLREYAYMNYLTTERMDYRVCVLIIRP